VGTSLRGEHYAKGKDAAHCAPTRRRGRHDGGQLHVGFTCTPNSRVQLMS
jgi:hypothetical protein